MRFSYYSKRYFPNAADLVRYLSDFANHFALKIRYNTRVVSVNKIDERFAVMDENGNAYQSQRLIVATGVSKPYLPAILGIELAEQYSNVSINPEEFVNQKVLIIGKGNSGFETADNLIETAALIHVASPKPLTLAWKSHFVGNLRAVNNNLLDTYQLKSQNAILDATINRITRHHRQFVVSVSYTHAYGEQEELIYDRVIACTGFRFDASIFAESCRPQLTLNQRFPQQTSEWESTNVAGLYFAGTLMQMRDYRKTTSGFIHGFRYNVQALQRIFASKYHSAQWPCRLLPLTPEALTAAVLASVNRSSALWQQFGFLCDLIVLNEAEQQACLYETMPVDYVSEHTLGHQPDYYQITLEYGANHAASDPFNVTRIERQQIDRAAQSNFLHPIIRRYAGSTLVAEHHVIEDLAAEWREDEHIQPLVAFFQQQLATPNLQSYKSDLTACNLEMAFS